MFPVDNAQINHTLATLQPHEPLIGVRLQILRKCWTFRAPSKIQV